MNTKKFSVDINAPRSTVWNVLWNDDTYRQWTSAFSEGSHARTDWKQGSEVLFLDDSNSGMVSTIAASRPHEFMSFKHLGVMKNGVRDLESDEVKGWAGAHENYTLSEQNGGTQLVVEIDLNDEFAEYFEKTFPIALGKVKELSEKR